MQEESQFGFKCGAFSVAKSDYDIILPGLKNAPLTKSLFPRGGRELSGCRTRMASVSSHRIANATKSPVWGLARRLYEAMERLDPACEFFADRCWDALTERERQL